MRLTPAGELRLTVPRGASIAGGLAFAERQRDWIVREWRRLERHAAAWDTRHELWYRGERVRLIVDVGRRDARRPSAAATDRRRRRFVRPSKRFLRALAGVELPARLRRARRRAPSVAASRDASATSGRAGDRVPRRGRLRLNWRLIQMPPAVSDYIILHELAHRRQPNHSARFWREVESLCPWWKTASGGCAVYGKDLL